MRDHGEGDVEVDDCHAEHEDGKGQRRRDAGEDGERDCEEAQERDDQSVDWIYESHCFGCITVVTVSAVLKILGRRRTSTKSHGCRRETLEDRGSLCFQYLVRWYEMMMMNDDRNESQIERGGDFIDDGKVGDDEQLPTTAFEDLGQRNQISTVTHWELYTNKRRAKGRRRAVGGPKEKLR